MNPYEKFNQFQRRAGMRQLCLLTLAKLGGRGTAREVARELKKAMCHVWPRFTELAETGKIRDTKYRVHGQGRPQVIWALTEGTVAANDNAVLGSDEPEIQRSAAPAWFENFGQ